MESHGYTGDHGSNGISHNTGNGRSPLLRMSDQGERESQQKEADHGKHSTKHGPSGNQKPLGLAEQVFDQMEAIRSDFEKSMKTIVALRDLDLRDCIKHL